MTVTIGGVAIGGDNPCRFIAELSNNHGGSLERCLRMITAAKDAGASFIKTQAFTADELVQLRGDGPAPEPWGSQGWTMRALYEKARTPFEWFPAIVEYCRDLEIPWFSSVFGPESLALLESLSVPAYKIARLDNQSTRLTAGVIASGKPVIISEDVGNPSIGCPTISLYCPPHYPQTEFCFKASLFSESGWGFGGFSYHGTDPLPCVVAATLGAKLIECHMQLEAEPSELESNVSLTEVQFADMVQKVRQIEGMLA